MVSERASRTAVTVRKIGEGDLDAVRDVLAAAFDDDPVINHFVRQDGRRAQRVTRFMEMLLRKMTFALGETYTTEGVRGAALWMPPGRTHQSMGEQLAMLPSLAGAVGWSQLAKTFSGFSFLEHLHPRTPDHFYLAVLGVHPAHQGQGIGSELMRPVLERCDREGIPAYLESSKERNVPLYERHGFRVVGKDYLPKGGPPLWRMWREPR
jgi:GNAT superfamily N-acetyltransferase